MPPSLESVVDVTTITHKFLPKQGKVERLIKQINRKVLRDTKLPGLLKDIKAAYLTSPHFKDIFLNLLQNRAPLNKIAVKHLENNARQYMIVDGLLFKLVDSGRDEPDTVPCIPTSRVHVFLDFYHRSIMGGHAGITKCYQTISQHFYCPNLAEHLSTYITGCHMCQLFKKGKNFQRPQKRMNINVPAMMKLSIDIKQMPPSHGYSHILVLLCEVSHYMVALPFYSTKMPHILDVFQRGYLAYFGPPSHIVCDQDPAFTSSLMEAFATELNIKLIMIIPTNHKSLQTEHGIKSLSGLVVKCLSETWSWHSLLPYAI